jgi:hypothetical protein
VSEETFRWVVAGGVVIVALFFAVMGMTSLAILMNLRRLMERLEPILKAANPIAEHAQEVVAIVKPRILKMSADASKISSDATEVSALVVTEARRYAEISKDVGERAKIKIARIDGAMDDTVEQVQEAGGAVKTAVLRPFHHLEGVVAGVRTAIHTYANGGRNNAYGNSRYRTAHDEEMFI